MRPIIDFLYKAFGKDPVGFGECGGDRFWEVFGDAGCQGVEQGDFSDGREAGEAREMEKGPFVVAPCGAAISVAGDFFPFLPLVLQPMPAAWALVQRCFGLKSAYGVAGGNFKTSYLPPRNCSTFQEWGKSLA